MESQEQAVEETSTQGTTQDTIAVTEASTDELKAFLAENRYVPEDEETEAPTEVPAQATQSKPRKDDSPKVEAAEQPAVEGAELPEQNTQQEIERLRREAEQRERFIARRSTELGEARKQLREAQERLKAFTTPEAYQENPAQAVDSQLKARQIEERLAAVDAEETQLKQRHETEQMVRHFVKEDEIDIPVMEKLLREDGLNDERYFEHLRRDPLAVMDGPSFISLAKRARDRKLAAGFYHLAQKLHAENQALKAKPEQVLGKVEKALNARPQVTAATGAAPQADFAPSDVTKMSTDQLKAYLKRSSASA